MKTIKILDKNLLYNGQKNQFVADMRSALSTTGFFLLINHGISEELLFKNRELFEKFFKETPEENRKKYCFPEMSYQTGYTPMNLEVGEFAKVADNKHYFQLRDSTTTPDIIEVPGLKETSEMLFSEFNKLYKELMQCVALSLGLPENQFDDELGNSAMRVIHYPENDNPTIDDGEVERGGNILGMCASKHTDIDNLTLLHATEAGLELDCDGEWVPVQCDPDKIIVNTGDMLNHQTAGLYKSGVHRVVCKPGVERFSSPFFGHRVDEALIEPLENLEHDYNKEDFPFKTEGEYLAHRLRQNNVMK